MQSNPYTPPRTQSEDSPPTNSPRPIAVWLLLLIFTAFTLSMLVGLLGFLTSVVSNPAGIANVSMLVIAIVWRFAFVALLVIFTISTFNRKPWARWVGLLVIGLLLVLCFLTPDTTEYPNAAQRSGGLLGRYAIFPALLAWWAYAYGFSAKAKRYFSTPSHQPLGRQDA